MVERSGGDRVRRVFCDGGMLRAAFLTGPRFGLGAWRLQEAQRTRPCWLRCTAVRVQCTLRPGGAGAQDVFAQHYAAQAAQELSAAQERLPQAAWRGQDPWKRASTLRCPAVPRQGARRDDERPRGRSSARRRAVVPVDNATDRERRRRRTPWYGGRTISGSRSPTAGNLGAGRPSACNVRPRSGHGPARPGFAAPQQPCIPPLF